MWKRPEKDKWHPPGQLVYTQERQEHTLGDYLENKYPEQVKKKLTFNEWWETQLQQYPNQQIDKNTIKQSARIIWNAAQENK